MEKIWKTKELFEPSQELINVAGSKLLAQLLLQRGVNTVQKIKDFLNPLQMKITSPFVFVDMQKSVDRIFSAIENKEKIIIYGDFDADGVTSTSLLYKTLKYLDANVDFYIPNRETENHGLNSKALVKLIAKHRAKLIITVDCGISDVEQVSFANSFKVDVIITDHHEAPDTLPEAYAILNPKAFNSLDKDLAIEEIESLNQLAGVGVAFKLACALLEKTQNYDFVDELLPLVAVGTIADVVPILNENRSFVQAGLKLIEQKKHYGIAKLLEIGGYSCQNGVTSENIAFGVAPRINAAGRLDTVDCAVKLLISDNKSEIDFAAQELDNFNKIRQNLCDNIYHEAIEMIQNEPVQESIILYKKDWHIGIIGIVASKLVETFYKPVFLMTKDSNTGLIRCSARSVAEIHLRDAIAQNEHLFEYFGGHAQAAGLVFDEQKNDINTVKTALNETIKQQLDGCKLVPSVECDLQIESDFITLDLIDCIKKLEPFGEANKSPLFLTKDLILNSVRTMGQKNNHLKILCENNNAKPFECVFWNHSELNIPERKTLDIVFYPKLNTFNGVTTIQLDIQDIKSEFMQKDEKSGFKLYDHRKKTNIYNQICDYLSNTKVSTQVFCQDKLLVEKLSMYKEIKNILQNRKTILPCSQIMFFDYPASNDLMSEILSKTGAKTLHFMNYNNQHINVQDFIKNISGMLKYVANSKNGTVALADIANFLGVSDSVIELSFDILESLGMFKVLSNVSNTYQIEFKQSIEFSKIKEHELFDALENELKEIYDYRQKLCNDDLEDCLAMSE